MKIKDFIKLNKLSISSVILSMIAIILIVVGLIISIEIISIETLPIAYVASGFIIGTNFCAICYNVVDLVMNWRNSK